MSPNKTVNATVDELTFKSFEVTTDNCGVKGSEARILIELNSAFILVEDTINSLLKDYPIVLPTFQTIDYTLDFAYQKEAMGLGVSLQAI
jgi:hypothetical protein